MKDYYHNILSENQLSNVDEEGFEFSLMKEIADHKIDKSAIRKWRKGLITTKGWKLLVEWVQSWIPFKDLKESNLLKTADYADTNNLLKEPAFKWWAKNVLRKKERIIYIVKSQY